jgi:hypothetical protein
MTDTEMKRKDPQSGDYSDLCSTCLVVSVEALLEMDGMVTDIDTIQLLDEREVAFIDQDDILNYAQQMGDNFEDNY